MRGTTKGDGYLMWPPADGDGIGIARCKTTAWSERAGDTNMTCLASIGMHDDFWNGGNECLHVIVHKWAGLHVGEPRQAVTWPKSIHILHSHPRRVGHIDEYAFLAML